MLVIKYGGHAQPNPGVSDPIIKELANSFKSGVKMVLVHGGAPAINRELKAHNIETHMVGGFRYTSPEVFEVVQRTLSGEVLRGLVNQFISYGVNAVGLSSSDGNIIRAKKMFENHLGEAIDIGLVGEIDSVNSEFLHLLLDQGYLPIISPIGTSQSGDGLNLNGDVVVGALGGALQAEQVLFLTDVSGIYRNWPDENSIISHISAAELSSLLPSFEEGMIPKTL